MKIIFVNRYYAPDHSATSQMLTDLATALATDYAVHVVTSRQCYDDPAASLARYELIHGVSVDRVRTTAFGRAGLVGRTLDYLTFYVAAFFRLLHVARRGDVIVAKTDPPLVSIPAGWVARIRGARLVNWLQDIFPEVAAKLSVPLARGAVGRLLARLRNRSLRCAAANVALGRLMRERVMALGVGSERVVAIANWADGAALQPSAVDSNPLREAWGVRDQFVVGYSGNFGRVHEFQTLLGAAIALREQANIAFLLIGDGAQLASVNATAVDQKLANLVFKPYQPRGQLSSTLGAADVHIVTLRPELEGLVVPSKFYGITAVGLPTIFIGDPGGEIGSIVRETQCGLCVTQGDVGGLVVAITKLRDDPALRRTMGSNARRVFEQRYDKRIAIAAWQSLLKALESPMGVPPPSA